MTKLKVIRPEYEIECKNVFVFAYTVLRMLPICIRIYFKRPTLNICLNNHVIEKWQARIIPHFTYKRAR